MRVREESRRCALEKRAMRVERDGEGSQDESPVGLYFIRRSEGTPKRNKAKTLEDAVCAMRL